MSDIKIIIKYPFSGYEVELGEDEDVFRILTATRGPDKFGKYDDMQLFKAFGAAVIRDLIKSWSYGLTFMECYHRVEIQSHFRGASETLEVDEHYLHHIRMALMTLRELLERLPEEEVQNDLVFLNKLLDFWKEFSLNNKSHKTNLKPIVDNIFDLLEGK